MRTGFRAEQGGWLERVCPRLWLAVEAERRFAREARAAERRRTSALLAWQRVEAHRELQLVRAWATGKRGYIIERERKLAEARRHVARLSVPVASGAAGTMRRAVAPDSRPGVAA